MATATVHIGDSVEISFRLRYNRAEVARRPDRQLFAAIKVWMELTDPMKFESTAPIEVTEDNQQMTFLIPIANSATLTMYEPGETWNVFAGYTTADGAEPAPGEFSLGTVRVEAAGA